MSDVMIIIPGKPCAWQRARSNGKIRFDSPEQRWAKNNIASIGFEAMKGRPPFEGPLELIVAAFWPWPKSISVKKKCRYGAQFHTARPDSDNLAKLLGDALNGIVWRDDSQICTLQVTKRYGLVPQTVVRIQNHIPSEE